MALRDWAQRLLAEEDQTKLPATIQLTAEGVIWETWSPPYAVAEVFVAEAEAVIAAFAEECPKRRIPLLFAAVMPDGSVKSQCPSSVNGKNTQADALVGAGHNTAQSFAAAMQGLSAVQVSILKAAKDMIDTQQAVIKQKDEQIHAFAEYFRVKQEVEATESAQSSSMNDYLLGQLKELMPHALEAWQISQAERRKALDAASAVKSTVAAATAPNTSNGVTS